MSHLLASNLVTITIGETQRLVKSTCLRQGACMLARLEILKVFDELLPIYTGFASKSTLSYIHRWPLSSPGVELHDSEDFCCQPESGFL
ncbi:unnamed protein product [Protopolystoma xenopodis]|uniref:Uncharacterized protein n=1 Tax=Protopolystoma xenopodis TaxID=117903 RepID=A0A3S5FEC7_9PLAT|nr:unnamed protein product [Protopolystoma xenopodis]